MYRRPTLDASMASQTGSPLDELMPDPEALEVSGEQHARTFHLSQMGTEQMWVSYFILFV